ncbi:MAG TPA: ABC transporter permease [Dehalococcoidia bacterium]|nr:ABC transporter permease [Dehalococcoidia bacterium]
MLRGFSAIGPLIWQRLVSSWRLLLVLAFGVLVASVLMAIAPVYTRVMDDLGLQTSLQDQIGSATRNGAEIDGMPLGAPANVERETALTQIIANHLGWLTGEEVRYGTLRSYTLTQNGGQHVAPAKNDSVITLRTMSGVEKHLRIVDGRFAEPTSDPSKMEGLMSLTAAEFGGFKVGDKVEATVTFDNCNRPPPTMDPDEQAAQARFRCTPTNFVTKTAVVTIVGIMQRLDEDEAYWGAGSFRFVTEAPHGDDPSPPDYNIMLPEQTFFQALPKVLPGVPSDFKLTSLADLSRLNSSNIERARADLAALETEINQQKAVQDLAMQGPLGAFSSRAAFNQVPLLILLLQVVGIAVYYVLLVSSLLSERRAEEVAMLRSRGASVSQCVLLAAGEAACIGFVAALVAPFLASGAIAALGKTSTFESISGGDWLPFTVVPASFLYALGGATIAVIAVILPAFFSARRGMVMFLRASVRPGKPILQRYYLDVLIVGFAALGLWQLNQKGSVFETNNVGGWSADPLVMISPFLLILAVGALMFRFLPLILGIVSRIVQATAGPGVTLGFWQLTRSPARYNQLALLVVMAAAVGTFAATYGDTTNRSQEERAQFAVGTDLRMTGLGRLNLAEASEVKAEVESIPGVEQAAAAYRSSLPVAGSGGARLEFLALDPEAAPKVLWFRDDFADRDLESLLRPLKGSPSGATGLVLPGEPASVSAWVSMSSPRPNTTLWVRTLDAKGVYSMHEFGSLDYDGTKHLEATLDVELRALSYPISIVALLATQIETVSDAGGAMTIDDIAVRDKSGEETVVDDFEGGFRWSVLPTIARNSDAVIRTNEKTHSGNGAALFAFRVGTGVGTRGLYVSSPNVPVPAIASRRLLENYNIRLGGEIPLVIGKNVMMVSIQGVVDYFPTMEDTKDGFLIMNQEHLFQFAGIIAEQSPRGPNEIWANFSKDPTERQAAVDAMYDQYGIVSGQIVDIETVLKKVRTDPVVRAGGSGILLLALIAAFSILALGFALTLYLGGQARTVEFSVMRAVGLSPRQVFVMIGLEYLLVAAIGLAIGTIAGLRISETMLSFLNVTEGGTRVVPPFVLTTQWDTVAIAFVATGVAFIVGVVALAFYFLKVPVSRAIRLTR